MIFVTVGTHEQPFNRLLKYIDEMKRKGLIKEEVIMQTGYSTYKPQYCIWQKLYPFQDMHKFVNEARIVITHGGPSSFIMPLQVGKTPIVVPRQLKYNEHVNDHQIMFCDAVEQRQGNIIVVKDVNDLITVINNYNSLIESMPNEIKSNNASFCTELETIINGFFK